MSRGVTPKGEGESLLYNVISLCPLASSRPAANPSEDFSTDLGCSDASMNDDSSLKTAIPGHGLLHTIKIKHATTDNINDSYMGASQVHLQDVTI